MLETESFTQGATRVNARLVWSLSRSLWIPCAFVSHSHLLSLKRTASDRAFLSSRARTLLDGACGVKVSVHHDLTVAVGTARACRVQHGGNASASTDHYETMRRRHNRVRNACVHRCSGRRKDMSKQGITKERDVPDIMG